MSVFLLEQRSKNIPRVYLRYKDNAHRWHCINKTISIHTHTPYTYALHHHASPHAPRTFLSLSNAAFSFFSHFFADRCICLLTIRKLIISSSNDTLFPISLCCFFLLFYYSVLTVKASKQASGGGLESGYRRFDCGRRPFQVPSFS